LAEDDRYSRQVLLWEELAPEVPPDLVQSNLEKSTVLVIGLGGTGSWMVHHLAAAGIGRLILVDNDVVEVSNLSRQAIYKMEDIGQLKVEVATRYIAQLNPFSKVQGVRRSVGGPDDFTDLLSANVNLVINCADHPDINTTSHWVSTACTPLGIPHIVGGGYSAHLGLIGPTIIPGQTACWDCYTLNHSQSIADEPLDNLHPGRPKRAGAAAPISAMVASFQAWDAIRLLGGHIPPTLVNQYGELDVTDFSIRWTRITAKCPKCVGTADVSTGGDGHGHR
jgi:molybdopterin/thiamine biosynthesis adenylyltransferase